MTTMPNHRMIEAHADLVTRMRTNAEFAGFVTGVLGKQSPLRSEQRTDEQAIAAFETMYQAARGAYCYNVSADMTRLIQHAANLLEDTDQFDPALAPTGCGLAYFDGGIVSTDARGKPMIVNWLLWGPGHFRLLEGDTSTVHAGAMISQFNDMILQPDRISVDLLEKYGRRVRGALGRWGFMGIDAHTAGERLGPPFTAPGPEQYLEIMADGDTPTPGTNMVRLAHAFWLLLNQTITYSSEVRGMPPAVKGVAKRARVPGRVTTVELRRRVNVCERQPGDERPVEWSHRWIVRGFWRWQRYGPGNTLRKRIWIDPYVKGPEDAPLAVTERVYHLKR